MQFRIILISKYNLRLKLQVTSGKLQAPSDTTCGCVDNFKKDLTMVQGYCRMYLERIYMDNEQLKRIADALEEILRLVKADQERSQKYMEERKDD